MRAEAGLWQGLPAPLLRDGWARRMAAEMMAAMGADPAAWQRFASGWEAMPVDGYMADGGRYRRRRFGVFQVEAASITLQPAQPHYQAREYNGLNGGVDRWFAPLAPEVAGSAILERILAGCRTAFAPLAPGIGDWRAEVHQFRIEATRAAAGLPTPEGVHRDGVTAGLIMLVGRAGVAGGCTRLWTPDHRPLAKFVLAESGEALFFDDRRLRHEVTPLQPAPDAGRGHRDVLVVTFAPAR